MDRQLALVLAEKINKVITVLNAEKKTPWDYGIGFSLYHSEVHLLDTIAVHAGENPSALAARLGITKGAITQVVKKLTEKELVESYHLPDNQKELYFRLTPLGKKAVRGHHKHHTRLNAGIFAYFESLTRKEGQVIIKFLDVLLINGAKAWQNIPAL
ncbi:MAG: MarR family transcriptional regulator [Candidatus Margulisbacteria bacterium]|jgi:DNA-binding MarR family transcriptional regulator|nr:MarR family transcriptional regulator [Candidatus Margulisiibacteriota bacterium]